MRTIGAAALAPLVTPVFGINPTPAPLDGLVYSQWTVDPTPLQPPTNTAPMDNQAHQTIRFLPAALDQMKLFLQPNGQVLQTCDGGLCNYPYPDDWCGPTCSD
jgi:hypothetical protein